MSAIESGDVRDINERASSIRQHWGIPLYFGPIRAMGKRVYIFTIGKPGTSSSREVSGVFSDAHEAFLWINAFMMGLKLKNEADRGRWKK